MNPQDPLASLHPLRQPDLIGWWPLAPGWWALIALLLLACLVAALLAYRRYRANAYRRQGLAQLEQLYNRWRQDKDDQEYLSETNALLKAVALHSFPRQTVASCSGAQWITFLNQTLPAKGNSDFDNSFAHAAYSRDLKGINCEAVQRAAAAWIQSHRVSA